MPTKPIIAKNSNSFSSVKLFLPIKQFENFTIKNYENSETFIREKHLGLLKSGRFETPLSKEHKPKWLF